MVCPRCSSLTQLTSGTGTPPANALVRCGAQEEHGVWGEGPRGCKDVLRVTEELRPNEVDRTCDKPARGHGVTSVAA